MDHDRDDDRPDGITARHQDVASRPWQRWVVVCCLATLPVLALANFFGQHPTTSRAFTPAVAASVTAPARLRSGLIFQVKVTIIAHQRLNHLALAFAPGWWESMSVNSIEPQPSTETSKDGQVVLDYGPLAAGRTLTSWIYFQSNPTNVGERNEDLAVMNGGQTLVRFHRSMTVFP